MSRPKRRREEGYTVAAEAERYGHIGSYYASQRQRGVGGRTQADAEKITGRMMASELTRPLLPWARGRVMAHGHGK